jgi:GntR family transcriptional regulator, transcriptional repressor for pyruvate dehydrogenase complex
VSGHGFAPINARGGHSARLPAYQVLADQLREQIASGRLRPGERLPTEPQMCVRSGLSRSTVREALRLLASQQLIVTTRGVTGGSFVAEPSVAKLGDSLSTAVKVLRTGLSVSGMQFLQMRELLEVPAAELAAGQRTEAHLAAMRASLMDRLSRDYGIRIASYWVFRDAINGAVGNPLLDLLSRPLREMANDRELIKSGPPDLWERTAADDRAVLAMVADGDGPGAADATRARLYGCAEVRLGR